MKEYKKIKTDIFATLEIGFGVLALLVVAAICVLVYLKLRDSRSVEDFPDAEKIEERTSGEHLIYLEFIDDELPRGAFEMKVKGIPYLCTEKDVTIQDGGVL